MNMGQGKQAARFFWLVAGGPLIVLVLLSIGSFCAGTNPESQPILCFVILARRLATDASVHHAATGSGAVSKYSCLHFLIHV